MKKIISGIVAGFIATIVISILMIIKTKMGLVPTLNPIADNAALAGRPDALAIGWLMHFIIGAIVWGIAFAIFSMFTNRIAHVLRGLIFGILAWLVMMIFFMPVAGYGIFAVGLGMPAIIMTLVFHLIYGLVLGFVYGLMMRSA